MKIQERFDQIDSLPEFLEFINNSEPSVTYLGYCHIALKKNYSPIILKEIPDKLFEIMKKQNCEFTPQERLIGNKIIKRIDILFANHNKLLNSINPITSLLVTLRTFISYCMNPWSGNAWDFTYENLFSYYNQNQYIAAFKQVPEEDDGLSPFHGSPTLWLPPE